MSKRFSDQDSGDKMEKELELVEWNEQKELALPSNSVFCEQDDDHPNDIQEECYNQLFHEDCNQPIINSVSDYLVKNFSS